MRFLLLHLGLFDWPSKWGLRKNKNLESLKFIYSEKATYFWKISTLLALHRTEKYYWKEFWKLFTTLAYKGFIWQPWKFLNLWKKLRQDTKTLDTFFHLTLNTWRVLYLIKKNAMKVQRKVGKKVRSLLKYPVKISKYPLMWS